MFTTASFHRTLATSPLLTSLIRIISSLDVPYEPNTYLLALQEVRRLRHQHTLRLFVLLLITLISTAFTLHHYAVWRLTAPVLIFITIAFTTANEFADTHRKKQIFASAAGLLHCYLFWLYHHGSRYWPIVETVEWFAIFIPVHTAIIAETAEEEFLRWGVKRRLDGVRLMDQAVLESMVLKRWYETVGIEVAREKIDGATERHELLIDTQIFQRFLELLAEGEKQFKLECAKRNGIVNTV
jgi:hypothetical protein